MYDDQRLARIESRLVQLCYYLGFDPVKEKLNAPGATSHTGALPTTDPQKVVERLRNLGGC